MGGEAHTLEAVFADLPAEKVKEYRVERCAYEWKPIKSIHLKPPGDWQTLVREHLVQRLLAQGDIYQIRGLIDQHPHRIALRAKRPRALARRLLELPGVVTIHFDGEDPARLEVETRAPDQFYAQLPALVLDDGYEVTSMESPDNNLEAVFRYLVRQ